MLFAAIVAVLAISVTNAYTPEIILAKWNPRNIYGLAKICDVAENRAYKTYETETYGSDSVFGLFGKSRKEWRDMRHCCNKVTPYQKKECLKDVRENVLDKYCDKGLNHICCKTEYESRYTCFARNPLQNSLVSDIYSTSYSPLESILEMTTERGVGCGRRCRQERRRERRVIDELKGIEIGNDYDTDYLETTATPFTYVEDVEDVARRALFEQREPMYTRYGEDSYDDTVGDFFERKEEIKEELKEELFDQDIGTRRWARETEAENIAEVLAQGVQTPWMDRRMANIEAAETLVGLGRGFETEIELEDERDNDMYEFERPCVESMRCKRKVQLATDIAAKRVCANKIYKTGKHESGTCCKAGAIVGKTAGRKNTDVCVPALYKFAAKTHGCVYNKPHCKHTFVECCRERAIQSRKENLIQKNLVRGDLTEEIFEESRRNPFY